jgi:diaminopimelate epimerase
VKFYKYHGLGNDYLVMNPAEIGRELSPAEIRLVCHRNYGIGSDGILWGPLPSQKAEFKLRIFNPDAGEAEKSGNGLRIFSRYLLDCGLVGSEPFKIETLGGVVRSRVHPNGGQIDVEMGTVSFNSKKIPVKGAAREVLNEAITVRDREFTFCAATIGNPHCVLPLEEISEEIARTFGPLIEQDARFPIRTNVQFMKVIDRNNICIEIWERGAGYTLASGSSSSAAAAVARRLGLCDESITVHMPGGQLQITVHDDFSIDMTGPVIRIGEGRLDMEAFAQKV